MRTLLALIVLLLCLTARAQLNYANTNTQQIISSLPTVLVNDSGDITFNPTTNMIVDAGWRWVTSVQQPSNGYAMSGSYIVTSTNQTFGTCSLRITNQYSLSAAALAANLALSNSWRGTSFVTNCQAFRTILRAFGTTETNAVVNSDTMSTWLASYTKTNTLTSQQSAQFIFMGQMYPQILNYSTTTATFPWQLIP